MINLSGNILIASLYAIQIIIVTHESAMTLRLFNRDTYSMQGIHFPIYVCVTVSIVYVYINTLNCVFWIIYPASLSDVIFHSLIKELFCAERVQSMHIVMCICSIDSVTAFFLTSPGSGYNWLLHIVYGICRAFAFIVNMRYGAQNDFYCRHSLLFCLIKAFQSIIQFYLVTWSLISVMDIIISMLFSQVSWLIDFIIYTIQIS